MRSSPFSLLGMFILGACATVAVQGSAAPTTEAPATSTNAPREVATVIALKDASRATSPNGKAEIVHLARGRNAYLGRLRMDPGGAVPVHRDPTEEFIHVLEGRGTMTIDGTQHTIEPGTTVYMPADAEVSYQNGDEELVAIQVFAGPEPASKYDAWTPASSFD